MCLLFILWGEYLAVKDIKVVLKNNNVIVCFLFGFLFYPIIEIYQNLIAYMQRHTIIF